MTTLENIDCIIHSIMSNYALNDIENTNLEKI